MKRIVRHYQGLPVREARANLLVQPSKKDIEGASPEDPTNCAYARCLKRTLECKTVFVFKSIAYIETLDEKGKPVLERYVVKQHAREYLLKFDGGQRVEPGGFTFHKPNRSSTLDYKTEQTRIYRRSPHAKIIGRATPARTFSLRYGTGQVHFIGTDAGIMKPRLLK
jgi:hypothetical protein